MKKAVLWMFMMCFVVCSAGCMGEGLPSDKPLSLTGYGTENFDGQSHLDLRAIEGGKVLLSCWNEEFKIEFDVPLESLLELVEKGRKVGEAIPEDKVYLDEYIGEMKNNDRIGVYQKVQFSVYTGDRNRKYLLGLTLFRFCPVGGDGDDTGDVTICLIPEKVEKLEKILRAS